MPTILRQDKYRFHFYTNENNEPAHIHVRSSDGECKFWLVPDVALARNKGIPSHEIRVIRDIIYNNYQLFVDSYDQYHHI